MNSIKKGHLEWIKSKGREKAIAKLAMACKRGVGIRLDANEVEDIILMDDALHTRLNNEIDRLYNEGKLK